MINSNVVNKRKFWLSFTALFLMTIVFQLACNGLLFATESSPEEKHFSVQVSGRGKPVILIPGLMSDARVWEDLSATLEKNYQVHQVNIAGFGQTQASQKPSLIAVKQQLLDYIRSQQLHQPALIGHSLGGFMSFWLSSAAPEEIGPMISVDGLPFIGPVFTRTNSSTVESLQAQALQIKNMYQTMTVQQMIVQSRYSLPLQASNKHAKTKIMDMISTSDPSTVGQSIFTLMSNDLRSSIGNISSPVLLLGASGGLSSSEQKAAMHRLYAEQLQALPNAKLVMHENARHFIMLDDPNWLKTQVLDFLEVTL